MTSDPPCCRATIRDGVITLNPWTPRLHGPGLARAGVSTVDAALADLRIDDRELIVAPVPHLPWDPAAEHALLEWAQALGYHRVWLPGRVVTLELLPVPLGGASVDCPTCGAHWQDGGVDFWAQVLDRGVFFGRCLACGGSLPEWTPTPSPEADTGAPTMRSPPARSNTRA
ncbi:hypothetical protein C8N24_0715 [Solirubrobacter pauli]|uniref:Uncharacterized protein n=1 Tax=Solirubrobacter pauli TaxID=166793 RepID=A0A660LAG4_9ACTN|nr:hypothetical protein [Solirubrobacter pauli]RKQ90900.1 hypothetical protein C8N24_0715 [Solirubrobacter pauli]